LSETKIVCTIGPASEDADSLLKLRKAGLSIARLNGSHNSLEWHAETVARIRQVLPGVPILLDIPGRKIRTIQLAHEPEFSIGDTIILTTDQSHDGSQKVPVGHPSLHEQLKPGTSILADDGTLSFTVSEISGPDIICRAETAGKLKSRKGINVPNVRLVSEMITDRDRHMIRFARDNGIDFIGLSFVESADQIEAIRSLTGGSWPRIVAKVENQGGLDNLAEIINTTDALMIDRGDLSAETSFEMVSLFQKRILKEANRAGIPVIVATEMLHTMVENPFPTKAEISDITNSILDGCGATMLSGETAMGANPVKAVEVMRAVADATDKHIQTDLSGNSDHIELEVPQAMERAVALLCRSLPITKIVAITVSGFAARMIAAHRPEQPILAVSNDPHAARCFNLYAGVEGVYIDMEFPKNSADHLMKCVETLWHTGKLTSEDSIVVVAVSYPKSGNRMNHLQTHVVGDLVDSLGWQS
jgi:pyruvate kinase